MTHFVPDGSMALGCRMVPGDQPVAVGALHVNETHSSPAVSIRFLQQLSPLSMGSGGDHVVGDGELQDAHQELDALEAGILAELAPVHMPVTHRFTPGLYAREIFMPAGTVLTSQVHNTQHPYVVISGRVRVTIPGGEVQVLEGGYVGITQPGTRRALYVEEDCRWITFHVLSPEEEEARQNGVPEEELLEAIRERIILKRERADGRDIYAEYQAKLKLLPTGEDHDFQAQEQAADVE